MAQIEVNLKSLREALCVAQGAIVHTYVNEKTEYGKRYSQIITKVIDEIDTMRPLGPDGKHGNRHTDYCGCEQ